MSDCPRQGRLIGGCRFEARYDRTAADPRAFDGMTLRSQTAVDAYCDAVRAKTYVHDICIRCGKTVKRQ